MSTVQLTGDTRNSAHRRHQYRISLRGGKNALIDNEQTQQRLSTSVLLRIANGVVAYTALKKPPRTLKVRHLAGNGAMHLGMFRETVLANSVLFANIWPLQKEALFQHPVFLPYPIMVLPLTDTGLRL